jgi:hypothetical protein
MKWQLMLTKSSVLTPNAKLWSKELRVQRRWCAPHARRLFALIAVLIGIKASHVMRLRKSYTRDGLTRSVPIAVRDAKYPLKRTRAACT